MKGLWTSAVLLVTRSVAETRYGKEKKKELGQTMYKW